MDVLPGSSHDDTSEIDMSFSSIPTQIDSMNYYSNIDPDIHWNRQSIKVLITTVGEHFEEFYDKTIKKKVLWKRLAQEMRRKHINCTPDECDKKWRNLKKSYASVLKKHTQSDFTSKFIHFDQMHAFLGKEIDPLGMREQAIKAAFREEVPSKSNDMVRTYFEVSKDGLFEWTFNAVTFLVNFIEQYKAHFETCQDIDSVWESINKSMNLHGFATTQEQCQRKWINLTDGFKHYLADAKATNSTPTWQYFILVQDVINVMNVPVTLPDDTKPNIVTLKGSVATTHAAIRVPQTPIKRRKVVETCNLEDEAEVDMTNPASTLTASLKTLEKNLKVENRLKHLEDRVQEAQRQKASSKETNVLLQSVLGELKRINKSLEEKYKKYGSDKVRLEEFDANCFDEETPIVDEEEYQQSLFNTLSFSKIHMLKSNKNVKDEPDEPDITVFVE